MLFVFFISIFTPNQQQYLNGGDDDGDCLLYTSRQNNYSYLGRVSRYYWIVFYPYEIDNLRGMSVWQWCLQSLLTTRLRRLSTFLRLPDDAGRLVSSHREVWREKSRNLAYYN